MPLTFSFTHFGLRVSTRCIARTLDSMEFKALTLRCAVKLEDRLCRESVGVISTERTEVGSG